MTPPSANKLNFADGPQVVRESFAAMLAEMPVLSAAVVTPAEFGGVSGLRIASPGVRKDAVLMYIHGGGYIAGSAESIRGLAAALGKAAGMTVYSTNYGLAPERACPAAVEDVVAVYKAIIADGLSPSRIVVGGESSGAGLTLAMLVALRDAGAPLPAAVFLISPWTDMALEGSSIRDKADVDPLLTEQGLRAAAAHYLRGSSPRRPDASPLYADLRGLPATLIHAGSIEILLDDAVRTAGALGAADVDVSFHVWPNAPHAFHVLGTTMPAASTAIDEIGAFLAARIPKA